MNCTCVTSFTEISWQMPKTNEEEKVDSLDNPMSQQERGEGQQKHLICPQLPSHSIIPLPREIHCFTRKQMIVV